ncbi:MAG: SMC family ATPase [Gemmatimonadota bacterium]|nr:SMC family ATPase [Gemmatimonadota bacterium]
MRLNAVRLCNFRQHADTRIEFDSGLTGIVGANGSGKSTILEAIAWAIYGNAAARGTRDSIRWMKAGPRASVSVELDFDLGGHRYRICRGLTSAELYLDGSATPIASTISGVTDLVQRRLGMTREEFFNTYFTGQKELSVMAAMGPSERGQFLSHVLGYERLRDAQRLLREQRSAVVAQIAGLRQGMPDADSVNRMTIDAERRLVAARAAMSTAAEARRQCQLRVAEITPRWEAAQHERQRVQELLTEVKLAEGEEAALTRDLERLDRDLAEIALSRRELEELHRELGPYAPLMAEFHRLEALAREEGRRQTLLESRHALEEEMTRLRERREKIESAPRFEQETTRTLEAKRLELEDADGRLELRRTEWVRDRQEAETKRQALRQQYTELKQQRDRLAATGAEGACPTCMRPLQGSLQSVLDMLDEQIETVRVDGNYYTRRIDQLTEMPDDVKELDASRRRLVEDIALLERRLMKVQLAVHEMAQVGGDLAAKEERLAMLERDLAAIPAGYEATRHAEVRRELDRLTPLDARAARLGAQIEREPHLFQERLNVRDQLGRVQRRVVEGWARRDALELSERDFVALRVAYERVTQERHAAEVTAVSAERDVAAAVGALRTAETGARELAERQRVLAELNARKRLHDELDRAYTDLRTDLNHQLRPELAELASGFLNDLTDGRYAELELDDLYNIVVLEDGVPKPVISGGEEDLSNLVLRLAISQMIAERAGQPFSLLVLDEIFGSLDESRRANVVELLRGLQDRFEQVIVITHIESVREGLDHVITVRFDEERSCSVVEAGPGGASGTENVVAPLLEAAGAAG